MKHSKTLLGASAALVLSIGCASEPAERYLDQAKAPASADSVFENGPMFLTGAFDGSKAFRMWQATTDFTRQFEREYGVPLKFTYFINSAYYDHTVTGSWIGTSLSAEESMVRFAITQQAANEGHEIGNHTVRHRDGTDWTVEQWRAEFRQFHDLVEANLFKPVLGDDGKPVFPRWESMPEAAPGEVGHSCSSNSDCDSGRCMAVAAEQSFCTTGCNKNLPCANGTVCGASNWNEGQDVCYPAPQFPVLHNGEVLFDEDGNPNLSSSQLEPYPIIGFRAPQLGHDTALFTVLDEFGYRYDTTKILRPGPPGRVRHRGQTFAGIYEFALMKHQGSRTIPMDYNYKVNDADGVRMTDDYKRSVRSAYAMGRQPWNIGHHFSLWRGGAYWRAMKDTFRYAAEGCPENGVETCENVAFPTFVELTDTLDGINAANGGDTDDDADVFAKPGVEVEDLLVGEAGCNGHDLEEGRGHGDGQHEIVLTEGDQIDQAER
ncbi:MAG: polysaccharide deacetylase family protein [Deltaproteobacteria bacterium]|nr:polysaccharide deacetylase family protein [Deltaproteobacteria bacterium]